MKKYCFILILLTALCKTSYSQNIVIKGKIYCENDLGPGVTVKFNGREMVHTYNKFRISVDPIRGGNNFIEMQAVLGTVPVKISNIPDNVEEIDLGKIEILPYSDEPVSLEEYAAYRLHLIDSLHDTNKADAILEKKFFYNIGFVICYPHFKPDYLESLNEAERKKLLSRSYNKPSNFYTLKQPSKNTMNIYWRDKRIVIPLDFNTTEDVIVLHFNKVYK